MNTRYIYTVNPKTGRKLALGYQYDDTAACLVVSSAECSNVDRFERRIARKIIGNRIEAGIKLRIPYANVGGTAYKTVAEYLNTRAASIMERVSQERTVRL